MAGVQGIWDTKQIGSNQKMKKYHEQVPYDGEI